jgi:predicted acyltransferase
MTVRRPSRYAEEKSHSHDFGVSTPMSAGAKSPRIVSMDQFRGYTVAGMFLVNFLGGYAAIHPVLKHNDTFFSYADSIMPSFMFAVGFSFRLTYLRRRSQSTRLSTISTYVRRSLALIVVSLVMYGFGGEFKEWPRFDHMPTEFEPFRVKAPHSNSFDLLVSKAKEENPGKDLRTTLEAASKIGETINGKEPKKPEEKKQFAIAHQAAEKASQEAIAETQTFIQPEVERKAAWESISPAGKFLVHWRIFFAKLLKSDLWETLAIIGVTQLVVLPFIGCGFLTRLLAMIGLGVTHCLISYWFNWDFVFALNDNWLSKLWMTGSSRSWDGGFFGPLSWGVAMMAGTLAYDLVSLSASHAAAFGRLFLWGVVLMAIGYGMSCLTRLYELSPAEITTMKERRILQDVEKGWLGHLIERQEELLKERRKPLDDLNGPIAEEKHNDFLAVYHELAAQPENKDLSEHQLADRAEHQQETNPRPNAKLQQLVSQQQKLKAELGPSIDRLEGTISVLRDQQQRYPNLDLAESPVLPPWERLKGRSLSELLAEPPFFIPPKDEPRVDPPPHIEHRPRNYWMMGKRMPNLSFITFATGFAFALYGVFVLACDLGGLRVGLFTTFGTNALAAYFLHHFIEEAVHPLVPHDGPLWYCLAGLALFLLLTYVFVRFLEKRKIYLKL